MIFEKVLITTLAALAALPTAMTFANLRALRRPDLKQSSSQISILIPARNEEAGIADCVRCALASTLTEFEVIVVDDHSTDATAEIVGAIATQDRRLRLLASPPLPIGWSGKQHACHILSGAAIHEILVFVDADVRLSPAAAARLAGALSRADLVSCVPQQKMNSLSELLMIPMINMLLLSYLPISRMREDRRVALGIGCGQLLAVKAKAYRKSGGHAAIRGSLHDGLLLPRLFRTKGLTTDIVDGAPLAACRMYDNWKSVLAGLLKNANEGMARPWSLVIWTVILLGGHVAPWIVAVISGIAGNQLATVAALAMCAGPIAARVAQCSQCREPFGSIILHPLTVSLFVGIQWIALFQNCWDRPRAWRGRVYPSPTSLKKVKPGWLSGSWFLEMTSSGRVAKRKKADPSANFAPSQTASRDLHPTNGP